MYVCGASITHTGNNSKEILFNGCIPKSPCKKYHIRMTMHTHIFNYNNTHFKKYYLKCYISPAEFGNTYN